MKRILVLLYIFIVLFSIDANEIIFFPISIDCFGIELPKAKSKMIDIGLPFGSADNIFGIQIGLLSNKASNIVGIQVAPIINTCTGNIYGLQFGFSGISNKVFGMQFGYFYAKAESIKGIQQGFFNITNELNGLQSIFVIPSFYNYAIINNGVQYGFVNYTESGKGLQLGLLNINKENGRYAINIDYYSNVISLAFESGAYRLFSRAILENYTFENKSNAAFGIGLGINILPIIDNDFTKNFRMICLWNSIFYNQRIVEWYSGKTLDTNINFYKHNVQLKIGYVINKTLGVYIIENYNIYYNNENDNYRSVAVSIGYNN